MEEKNDHSLLGQIIVFILQAAFIILAIVFTILTFGIFLPDDEKKSRQKRKRPQVYDPYEKLCIELKNKKACLAVVKDRVAVLLLMKDKIARREKRIFFAARLVIISILLLLNWCYLQEFRMHRELVPGPCIYKMIPRTYDELIDLVVTFNGMILLLYSVPAYLLYGTVNRFTHVMKAKMIHFLSKKHQPTFSELKMLKEEEQRLIRQIGMLEDEILVLKN